MKPLRRLTNLLAACAVTAAAFGQPALAADLRNDPVVQDLLRRENFDPGKKFHLFGKARGTVAERTGLMTISPTITQRLGNLQMETATIFSNPGSSACPDTDMKSIPRSTTVPAKATVGKAAK